MRKLTAQRRRFRYRRVDVMPACEAMILTTTSFTGKRARRSGDMSHRPGDCSAELATLVDVIARKYDDWVYGVPTALQAEAARSAV